MIEDAGAREVTPTLTLGHYRRERVVPDSTDHRARHLHIYLVVLENEKVAPCWRGCPRVMCASPYRAKTRHSPRRDAVRAYNGL